MGVHLAKRKHRTMLSVVVIFVGFCFANVHGEHHDPPGFPVCSEHLVIGGIYYDKVTLLYVGAVPSDCYWTTTVQVLGLDLVIPCVYQMKGIPGSRYCIKFGDEKTVVAQVQPLFCTYEDSQYKYRPLQNNTVADNATECSEKCTAVGDQSGALVICRGWSYGPLGECYLYPFPESLDKGLIQPLNGWTSGPRNCIPGGPSNPA